MHYEVMSEEKEEMRKGRIKTMSEGRQSVSLDDESKDTRGGRRYENETVKPLREKAVRLQMGGLW